MKRLIKLANDGERFLLEFDIDSAIEVSSIIESFIASNPKAEKINIFVTHTVKQHA